MIFILFQSFLNINLALNAMFLNVNNADSYLLLMKQASYNYLQCSELTLI